MAHVCPGLLCLTAAFEKKGRHHESRSIRRAVIEGRRLGTLLRLAASYWASSTRDRDAAYPGREERMRLFIRLAGSRVSPTMLWRGPLPVLVAEDIPRGPEGNLAWYRLVHQVVPALRWAHGFVDPEQHRALCAFVSRHAVDLARICRSLGRSPAYQLRLLALHSGETGRRIGRNSNPVKVIGEMDGLRGRRLKVRRQRVLALLDGDETRRPFPLPPFAKDLPLREEQLCLELLDGHAAVLEEAEEMKHCVADYIPAAAGGFCHLLRATVSGERLTVLIEKDQSAGDLRLGEIRGKGNRLATRQEVAAVQRRLVPLLRPVRSRSP